MKKTIYTKEYEILLRVLRATRKKAGVTQVLCHAEDLCQIAETLRLKNAFRPCLRRCWATTKHLIYGRTGHISISTWLELYFDLRDCSHQVPASTGLMMISIPSCAI